MSRSILAAALVSAMVAPDPGRAQSTQAKSADANPPPPVQLTAQQDHKRMMQILKIEKLRPGANDRSRQAPDAANYDEAKANPYPHLPDSLVLKNGEKVTTAEVWWNRRRPEIVEDFDREIYGRVPKDTPGVKWEVTGTSQEKIGDVLVVTKQLVGHIDNSSNPQITVDLQLTLTTPASASGPVPVMMEFGFGGFGPRPAGRGAVPKGAGAAPPAGKAVQPGGRGGGPSWQQFLAFADRYIKGPPPPPAALRPLEGVR
jgi:hypothetical protein